MRRRAASGIVPAMITTTPTTGIPTGTWTVDPAHTTVGFTCRHAGVSNVRGSFGTFSGTLEHGADGSISARGSVAVASVDTGVSQRDDHLRSADFFDAEHHPEMTFATNAITLDGEDVHVRGELTLRGVTRPLELRGELGGPALDDDGALRVGLSLRGELSRAAYGMRFNHALGGGNVLVADKVRLELEVSAVHAA
jgi:polyisoprenoid-binding protein YceI